MTAKRKGLTDAAKESRPAEPSPKRKTGGRPRAARGRSDWAVAGERVRKTVWLLDDVALALEAAAKESKTPANRIIEAALREYLDVGH